MGIDRIVEQAIATASQQQHPVMNIAAPMNDEQLVSLIAAMLPPSSDVKERVGQAVEIVAESIAQLRRGKLAALMKLKMANTD